MISTLIIFENVEHVSEILTIFLILTPLMLILKIKTKELIEYWLDLHARASKEKALS